MSGGSELIIPPKPSYMTRVSDAGWMQICEENAARADANNDWVPSAMLSGKELVEWAKYRAWEEREIQTGRLFHNWLHDRDNIQQPRDAWARRQRK
jgi:hypothetical protein